MILFTVGILTTSNGSSTAGEDYTLQCSTNGTSEPAKFQWLTNNQNEQERMVISDSSIVITNNTSSTQLQFMALSQRSHNGSYCCSAMVHGISRSIRKCFSVSVNGICTSWTCCTYCIIILINFFVAPILTVGITNDRPPVVGQQYVLSATISGNGHLNSVISYQWSKYGHNIGTNSSEYLITTLQLSNGGKYACKVTISSSYLNGDYAIVSGLFEVVIQSELA